MGLAIMLATVTSCNNSTTAPETNADSTSINVADSTSCDTTATDIAVETTVVL